MINTLAFLPGDNIKFIVSAIIIVVVVIIAAVFGAFFKIWLQARFSNAPVSFPSLIGMWLRKIPSRLIVDARITAVKAGLQYQSEQLETHYLSGGNVSDVILSLIAADRAGISLDYNRACAIDLAVKGTGKTVLEAVRTSINPKVIDCPNPDSGKDKIEAVARDGISLRVRARVTVRTNLERLVGGATEETVVARVGEGIVTYWFSRLS